ncbi:MAG: hypothetical protein K0R99_1068 [Microbacterium sp.]|jgi:hypothetical protein|uniref:hypothetical protein n=1 Tax=Microbacterium sp. TaxID=51671 RepID=UPI00262A90EC|nr:hypothetical protein [Microbacterium sp.]MDF2559622.1 hypothetical protein [Microbacterium sp.]
MSRRWWWLIGGVAGVVVLVAAGLWIWQATSHPATAEEAAEEYLHALESGDPSAVEATGAVVEPETLEAFSGATAFVEDAEVVSVDGDHSEPVGGVTATAEVSFRLADEEHTAQLTLSPIDGRWVVDDSGRGSLTATPSIGSFVSIGEQTLPAGEATTLLPATYAVTAAPAELLSGESSVTVFPGDEQSIDLKASLRPEATVAAQKQLDDHLQACTAPGDTPPADCGIRIPWGTEFRAVSEYRYRIEKLPTLALTGTDFTAEGGILVTTVAGTGQDGAKREATYRTDSWTARGDVSFTAEDVVLTAW